MPRTPVLERPSAVRTIGVGFIALMVLFAWFTYAVFNKKFTDSVPVTIVAAETGLQLPKNAEVKIRGVDVGEVRSFDPVDGGVELNVAMSPAKIGEIPADVSALIVPKTLFGQKYVALQIPDGTGGKSLRAGDVIDQAEVPIEVEKVLNDLYPLLETVQPAEISYTLSAVATALDGRGERIGKNLVRLDSYLDKLDPQVPQLVDDVEKLGKVADQYADVMPDLGRFLTNAVVTGDTVVAKRAQLQAFFTEATALSDTTTSFLNANSANLIGVARESRPTLGVLAEYAPVFPCLFKGVARQVPRYNNLFRGRELHINLELIGKQPTGYAADETPDAPDARDVARDPEALGPHCHSLPDSPYDQQNKAPIPPFEVYRQTGIRDRHNKFRTAPNGSGGLVDLVQPSMTTVPGEKETINELLAPTLGMRADEMPDVASLLAAPVLRGSEVKISADSR